jgi:Rhs element Vgr protein
MGVVTPTILSNGRSMDLTYDLFSIDIVKEVNRIPYAQLILLDGDAAQQSFRISNSNFFAPGKEIEIKLRYENDPETETTVFKGIVVGHGVEADPQGSLLTVELKDSAMKLTLGRKSAIYREQRDDQIITTLIEGRGLQKDQVATTQVKHPEMVRYYCTDWDFILSRAEACGLLVKADNGKLSLVEASLDGAEVETLEYGISEIYNFSMEIDAQHQYAEVHTAAWDGQNQKLTESIQARAFDLPQQALSGEEIAGEIDAGALNLTHPVTLSPDELRAWANGAMMRQRLSMLKGRIAVSGSSQISLLDILKIDGIGNRFNGKTLVTGIRHRVDQHGWQTDYQFGLPAETFARRYDIVDSPAAGLLPAIQGLHIGVVGRFQEDPDQAFRVPVLLPGINNEEEAVWARLVTPDAGPGRGFFFRPESGDEVIVGFLNDDPRQAVILGALYSSVNTPHESVSSLTEENTDKAIVTKKGTTIRFVDAEKAKVYVETPLANKIVLDDDEETIQLADQHGNTITMSKDGIELKSAKDLIIDSSGNVEIKGNKVDIK